MKVLLVNPNFRRKVGKSEKISTILPPMGIAYIAAVLKKEGFEVRVVDSNALNLDNHQIVKIIKEYGPEIAGFTATTPTISKVFDISKMVKNKFPEIKIVVGGPHPTALPNESIEQNFVDFVVRGEGEYTMLELAREIKNKKNFGKIKGLVYKKNGKIKYNGERQMIENLDSLPLPARELLPLDRYSSANSKLRKFVTILTSRGCPGRCTYCNKMIFGNGCRMRSAESIVKEIKLLNKKYGYREFHILDDLFTINRQRVVDFCNLILEKKIKILWKCGNGVRVGNVDLELLKLMKKAGCYSLSYGIESGNQSILNRMRKGQTLKQCENAVRWTKQAGIDCIGFFILGNLGENEKTMQETIDFAKKLDLDIAQFSILVPFPGTEIRKEIERDGKIFEKDWSNYDNLEGKAIFEHGNLTRESMERMHKKAYNEFYMRARFIIRRILRFRSMNELKNEINGFLALLGI